MSNHKVILNSTNKVTPSRYEYVFPSTQKFKAGDGLSLDSISLYNSIFNVEAVRGNNRFSIIWNADTSVQHDFTIPDGNYDIPALNYFIQSVCVVNNLYLIDDATGKYVYYISLKINFTGYNCQIESYPLPTAAEATALGYSIPAGAAWTSPVTAKTPQFIIPTGTYGNLIGFQPGTYPTTVGTAYVSSFSTSTPQIAPVNSITIGCNMVSSAYANPSHVFTSIPIDSGFGSLIKFTSDSSISTTISAGSYGKVVITLYSQTFEELRLHDDEVVIVLNIFIAPEIMK